jgi:hypothetical protein
MATPMVSYPRPVSLITGKYPSFVGTIEEEQDLTKTYVKNNRPCSKEAVQKFLKEYDGTNQMVLSLKEADNNFISQAYWGYTEIFQEDKVMNKAKCRIIGNILNDWGGIDLMRASYYLISWDMKNADSVLISGYTRLLEHYWDEIGEWMA